MNPTNKGSEQDALKVSARFLEKRIRFVREVEDHLAEKGFDSESTKTVIQKLLEHKVLNDERDSEAIAKSYDKTYGWGSEKIRHKLLERGVSEALIEQALSSLEDSEGQRAVLALTKAKKTTVPGKCARFLASRGFSESAIEEAVLTYCKEAEECP